MHDLLKSILVFILASYISGCVQATESGISPPKDTEWIKVEVKNPSPYTQPFPLEVVYISSKCQKKRISGFDGSTITEPRYNAIRIPLQQQPGSDIWQTKVASKGGGRCNWTLSEFDVGIEYVDAVHLRKDLVPGTAAGATIAFDAHASRNGQFTFVKGDVILSPKYYPYISEWNRPGEASELSLLGKEIFLSIRADEARIVKFYPVLDEKKIVRYIGLPKKVDGERPDIVYPNGSIVPWTPDEPRFDKVDAM